MKEWFIDFWKDNGQRIVYMTLAAGFGVMFVRFMPDMAGEGKTLLVGVATFCLTRMRGGNTNDSEKK